MGAWEEIRDLVDAGNGDGLVDRLAGLDDGERKLVAGELRGHIPVALSRAEARMRERWEEERRRGSGHYWGMREPDPREDWADLMLLAGAGTLSSVTATASWLTRRDLLTRRSLFRPSTDVDPAPLVRILARRPPEWQAELAVRLAARLRGPRDPGIPLALAMLRHTGAEPPPHDPLVVAWVSAGVGPDPDPLLPVLLPRIFEADGVGRVLLNERFHPISPWLRVVRDQARAGADAREAVLDGCVRRFLRGGTPQDLRFFTRVHELLEPTAAEVEARARDYLRLLPAAPGTVAALALLHLRRVHVDDPGDVAEAIEGLVFRAEAKLVRAGLVWLDQTVRQAPERADELAPALVTALRHESHEIRDRAVRLTLKLAGHLTPLGAERIREALPGLATAEGERLAAVFGGAAADPEPVPPFVPPPLPEPPAARAFAPTPATPDAMRRVGRTTWAWQDAERWLAGFVRHAGQNRDALRTMLDAAYGGAYLDLFAMPTWSNADHWREAMARELLTPGVDPGPPAEAPTPYRVMGAPAVAVHFTNRAEPTLRHENAADRTNTEHDSFATQTGLAFQSGEADDQEAGNWGVFPARLGPGHVHKATGDQEDTERAGSSAWAGPGDEEDGEHRVFSMRADGYEVIAPQVDGGHRYLGIADVDFALWSGGRGTRPVREAPRDRLPRPERISPPHLFILRRHAEILDALKADTLPPVLLATPTLSTGALDPDVLVARLEECEAAHVTPLPADLQQALLRLPRGVHTEAASRAARLTSGAGRTAARWLAGDGLPDPETGVRWGYSEGMTEYDANEHPPGPGVQVKPAPRLKAAPSSLALADESHTDLGPVESRTDVALADESRTALELVDDSRTDVDLVDKSGTDLQSVDASRTEVALVDESRTALELVDESRTGVALVDESGTDLGLVDESGTEVALVGESLAGLDLIDELLSEPRKRAWEDHGGHMDWWPAILPSHREVVAVNLLPHLLERGDRPGAHAGHAALLAEADGPAGSATALVMAYFLARKESANGVAVFLAMAARGELPAAEVGVQLGLLVRWAHSAQRHVVDALATAADRGAHLEVWPVLRTLVPALLPSVGEQPRAGLAKLLELATTVAERTDARGEIPEVATIAARRSTSAFVHESRRLHETLTRP
ncbi:DUF7824 domain-containing protein [Sphaerisporangium corydalis]|uniref:DUF6493 family protein n=1 Tax=Sphaerisporangium corydalis TaxID=1441875 RepID=A0ABV9E966_9ACTN|nr:DUF6493 family protein [Sphaerisporangium corydalis]